jgi:hypothetical protein
MTEDQVNGIIAKARQKANEYNSHKKDIKFNTDEYGNGVVEVWDIADRTLYKDAVIRFEDTGQDDVKIELHKEEKIIDKGINSNFWKATDKEETKTFVYEDNELHLPVDVIYKVRITKEQIFRFEIKRVKSIISDFEQMEIKAYSKERQYGAIQVDLVQIRTDFMFFKRYGVILQMKEYSEVTDKIEKNYLKMTIHNEEFGTALNESARDKIYSMYCRYIKESMEAVPRNLEIEGITVNGVGGLYCMDTEAFKIYLEGSDYNMFKVSAVKKAFARKGYIHTNADRYDYMLNPHDEDRDRYRVIAFYKNKVDQQNIADEQKEDSGEVTEQNQELPQVTKDSVIEISV